MKFLKLFFIAALFVSCSSENDNTNTTDDIGDYYPNAAGNTWTYAVEVSSDSDINQNFSETDIVSIDSGANSTNFTIEANGNNPAFGSANFIFESGSLTKSNSTLRLTGTIDITGAVDAFEDLGIGVSDFLIYDLNAANNDILSTSSSNLSENLDLNGTNIPVNAAYTINTKKLPNLDSFTVLNQIFNDVIVTQVSVNIGVDLELPLIGTQALILPQDALVITIYFAKNVGVIKSVATQSIEINPAFIALTNNPLFPDFGTIPSNVSFTNVQDLESYTINVN